MKQHWRGALLFFKALKIKMFAEGWVVYPRSSRSREPTWHEARSTECQVGSRDPRGLGYTTQPSANILIFIIAHALPHILQSDMSQQEEPRDKPANCRDVLASMSLADLIP